MYQKTVKHVIMQQSYGCSMLGTKLSTKLSLYLFFLLDKPFSPFAQVCHSLGPSHVIGVCNNGHLMSVISKIHQQIRTFSFWNQFSFEGVSTPPDATLGPASSGTSSGGATTPRTVCWHNFHLCLLRSCNIGQGFVQDSYRRTKQVC